MIDLQIAIADYASEHKEFEREYRMRGSIETLPLNGNQEGDVFLQTSDNTYYLYDNGWQKLVSITDIESVELATKEDVLAAIKAGKEKANG